MDLFFHYPPELLALLKDVIPKLNKSKPDLLTFFQSAGVEASVLAPYRTLLATNKEGFNKYHVTRELLTHLSARGEAGLGERRAILKRVTDTDDFSVCWESDRAAAQGLVAQIRTLVDVKDIATCRDALAGGAIVTLCRLQEIVHLLERRGDLRSFLKAKVNASIADRKPFFEPPVLPS